MESAWDKLKYYFLYHPGRTHKLIVINAAVFLIEGIIGVLFFLFAEPNWVSYFIQEYLTAPSNFQELFIKPWTPITYMFLHSGFFHILFNMLWLHWLGNIFESFLGNYKILWIYIIGGLVGYGFFILSYNLFPVFAADAANAHVIGASAAVMAVVAATATLVPNYAIRLFLIGNLKLKYLAIAYFLIDLIAIRSNNAGGHIAHIGGAFAGFILIKLLQNGYDIAENAESMIRKIGRIFETKPKLKKTYTAKVSKTPPREKENPSRIDQKEIDRILDKIRLSGYDSLTKEEKGTLFKASK